MRFKKRAARQDRSLSWIVQKAWKIARKEIMKYPSVNEIADDADDVRGVARSSGLRFRRWPKVAARPRRRDPK